MSLRERRRRALRSSSRVAGGCLFLVAAAVAPELAIDGVDISIPRALVSLPSIEYRSAKVHASAAGVKLHFFDVRAEDPKGRAAASIPHVEVTFDGRISLQHPELELAAPEPAAPERDDHWSRLAAARSAITELAAIATDDRIRSISVTDLAITVGGRPFTSGARVDLLRHRDRVRGLAHLGTVLPGAELFLDLGARDLVVRAEHGPGPFDLDSARLVAIHRFAEGTVEVAELDLSIDGTWIDGTSILADRDFEVDLHADRAELRSIERYWPKDVCASGRRWVARHLTAGAASDLHLVANERTFALDFDFRGIAAKIAEVPPISRARGRAHLAPDRLDVRVASARVGRLRARRGKITLSGMERAPGRLTVDAQLSGAASAALRLLRDPPLPPRAVSGRAVLQVALSAPFDGKLHTEALELEVRGRGRNVALRDFQVMDRFTVTGADVAITADLERFEVDGTAAIDGVPMQVSWRSPNRVRVQGTLDRDDRRALGISEIDGVEGPVTIDLAATPKEHGTLATGTLDLANAAISIPELDWRKPPGRSARMRFSAEVAPDGGLHVRRLSFRANELSAYGGLEVDPDQRFSSLRLSSVRLREDAFSLSMNRRRTVIYGASFDARSIVRRMLDPAEDGTGEPDRTINIDVARVRVTDDVTLAKVIGLIRIEDGQLDEGSGVARLGGSKLSLRARRAGDAHRIDVRASDAGRLARGLGIDTSLSGGRARITGVVTGDLGLAGRAVLHDFRIDRPSTAAKIVSVTSLSGIADLIRGDGLRFDRADVRFSVEGETLTIADAYTSGGPLGLSTQGQIDLGSGRTELVARVSLLNDLNRLLRKIPLLGRILAPEGDALLFAPAYSVNGNLDHPTIRVKPESLLIPAFIRRLFE